MVGGMDSGALRGFGQMSCNQHVMMEYVTLKRVVTWLLALVANEFAAVPVVMAETNYNLKISPMGTL